MASPAWSEPQEFRFIYDAPSGCPDRDEALSAIASAAGNRLRVTEKAHGVIQVAIHEEGRDGADADERRFTAHIALVDTDQRGAIRRLDDTHCDALVESAAEIIASWPPESPPPPPDDPAPPPPDLSAGPAAGEPPPNPPRPGDFGAFVGARWFVPERANPTWGNGFVLGARWRMKTLWSLRAAVTYWDTGPVERAENSARMRIAAVRGYLCPVEPKLSPHLAVSLCLSGEVGRRESRIEKSENRLWGMAGPALRLRISTDWLFAEFEPTLDFRTVRRDRVIDGDGQRVEDGHLVRFVSVGAHFVVGTRFGWNRTRVRGDGSSETAARSNAPTN